MIGTLVIAVLLCSGVRAAGRFELKILQIRIQREELLSGNCCDGSRQQGQCKDKCDVFVRLCMKEFQHDLSSLRVVGSARTVAEMNNCSLGSAVSPVLARTDQHVLAYNFSYHWPRSFSLVVDIMDSDNDTRGTDELIDRIVYGGVLMPDSSIWRTLPLANARGVQLLETNVRLSCSENYFGANCARYCNARNDSYGRFTCDAVTGDKKCIFGWMGEDCSIPVCRTGCQHGSCLEPGTCDCAPGWEGQLCEQCVRYPGCQNGDCSSPFQCTCRPGWGGPLCDLDLNMCERHRPCKNGGTCVNKDNGYTCDCPPNYEGVNCTELKQSCNCENGGTCLYGTTYECRCQPGFTGPTCSRNVDECSPNPCERGGRCTDLINGFRCECPPGWIGPRCNIDLQKCQSGRCRELAKCTRSAHGGYECECSGSECSNSSILCRGQCKNGGTCLESISGIICSCPTGYAGPFCESLVDHCASQPCKNHGKCTSTASGAQCNCYPGHEGEFCEIDTDHCDPNPCRNGATCFDMGDDYFCACPYGYEGKHCAERSRRCEGRSCSSVDLCLIAVSRTSNTSDVRASELTLVPTNVCGPHGTCFNKDDGGFFCACAKGYRGTYCQENINDCEPQRCQNGGTCLDAVGSYQCICPIGYEGRHCERANEQCCQLRNTSCSTRPCKNGGTCVVVGHSHTCICRDGFTGSDCSININECATSPCFNGAQCQDFINYRECHCLTGYAGHDCRININECDQNPCTYGSECVDTPGSYKCKCPPNREGQHCEVALGRAKLPSCTVLNGRRIEHGEWFEENCRNCSCDHGELLCEKIPCIPDNCLPENGASCPADYECIPQNADTCFTPPCVLFGSCKSSSELAELHAVGSSEVCLPNQREQNANCVRMLLTFDRTKLPRGVSVKMVCDSVKQLSSVQRYARQINVAITCGLNWAQPNVIEVTLHSTGAVKGARVAASTLPSDLSDTDKPAASFAEQVTLAAAKQIGHRLTNNSLLAAVFDIRVEVPAPPLSMAGSSATVMMVLCAAVVAFGVLAVLALVMHHKRAVAKITLGAYSDLPNNIRFVNASKTSDLHHPVAHRQVSCESKSNRKLPPVPHTRQNSCSSNLAQGKSFYMKRQNELLQNA